MSELHLLLIYEHSSLHKIVLTRAATNDIINVSTTADLRVPLKTALNRENEMIAPYARKGSESLLTQVEET